MKEINHLKMIIKQMNRIDLKGIYKIHKIIKVIDIVHQN
jgi:hypothetical protein